ncbi:MAG: phosphoribosyltransferase, partial [Myxococcota bacterium]
GEFDAVVGVLSGGAFIARCVAEHHKIARVHYVRSRIWSNLSLHRNLMTSLRYYLGHENRPSVYFLDDHIALKNARVLVVDDSVCTGATLSAVEALCLERGAREVKTLALYAHPDHVPDYVSQVSMTPLIWPWGWEAD